MMFTVFANWKCRPNGTMKEYVPNDQFIHQWGLIEPSAHLFIQRIHRDDLEDYRRSAPGVPSSIGPGLSGHIDFKQRTGSR